MLQSSRVKRTTSNGHHHQHHNQSHVLESFDPRARYSHRNVDPKKQMLLAESLFDPGISCQTHSRLEITFTDLSTDRFAQAYFDAFSDTQPEETSCLIKIWIRMCKFKARMSEGTDSGTGTSESDAGETGRKAQSIVNRITAHPDLLPLIPEAQIKRLQERIAIGDLEASMFDPMLQAIGTRIEKAFKSFVSSQFFLKYQIDIMTNGMVSLSDIIFCDRTLFFFLDFMEKEGMRKYLDFILIIHSYRQLDAPRNEDQIVIWKRYFDPNDGPDSAYDLHFSDNVCRMVREGIQAGDIHAFDIPASIVHQYLEKTYFKQFQESVEYFELTTEMISQFQSKQLGCSASGAKSGDGNSLPDSSSSQRTATDPPASSSQGQREMGSSHAKTDPEMTVKSAENPNDDRAIWRRELAGRLQIAHVDRYGRIISDLEPQPEKIHNKTNFSQSIRNFVTRSASKQDSNQALAWKIAQTIIDEVVNVTTENT